MKLNPKATIYLPNQVQEAVAIPRITHLAIGAHQDDLEIMSFHGILTCFDQSDKSYFGVVATDGRGSARANEYATYSDEEMMKVRDLEQIRAAQIGKYGALALLRHPSVDVKDPQYQVIVQDILELLRLAKPEVLYTHNPADKHETHVAVACKVIEAVRCLPIEDRPMVVYGCEVWGDLDWLDDSQKVALDVGHYDDLAKQLLDAFPSQIRGGKRYDLATIGRRQANATYFHSHDVDQSEAITFAMDLTPLIQNDDLTVEAFLATHLHSFQDRVMSNIRRITAK
jgi:LmbE family N-acetylglucosaminyl deacetylase